MEETNISSVQNTTTDQSVPPVVGQITQPTVPQQVQPTFTNNVDLFKKLGAVVFIVAAFVYVGNFMLTNKGDFSLPSLTPKEESISGKALLKKITNKAVIKDVKSLTELHEKEGLLKDNLAVYRCNFIVDTFSNCVVQDVVKHPETFVRISNIYGQDSDTVYVLDGDSNRYKVFSKPEYKTFRSYFDPNESHYGLYSWDDHQIFKGEKVIRGSSSSTLSTTTPALKTNYNAFRSTFYKQYYKGDVAGPRNPYQGITQIDGNIQFASDGEYIYHGDGRSSATSDSIYVFKVNEADLATFQPYLQKMMGTSYLKYATDMSQVFCDNVRVDEEGYPVSDGLTIIKDPNPKSFQVIYPTSAITVRNADVQVAKTDTQVFVNCAPQSHVDAPTFTTTDVGYFYKDKDYIYLLQKSTSTESKNYALVIASSVVKDKTPNRNTPVVEQIGANKKASSNNFLDGNYFIVSKSAYYSSSVHISASNEKSIQYAIDTDNLGHVGSLGGTAYKDMSTSSLVYISNDFHNGESQEGCKVKLSFPEKGVLYYNVVNQSFEKNRYTHDCSLYRGAHGSFFIGEKHVRDLPDNSTTLVTLGFTENDRKNFEKLDKQTTQVERYAEELINYSGKKGEGIPSARKITSSDIKDSYAYAIESANLYDSVFACDFAVGGGSCEYGAFIKNNNNGYWLMGGSNYTSEYGPNMGKIENPKKFIYRTTESEWKNKLPAAFKSELKRLGLTENDVDFGN